VAESKRSNDLLGKLAELSEEAMHRLQEAPGGDRVVGTMNAMRDRVDELQRRVRGIDELEQRLSALERKVEKLSKSSSTTPARTTKSKS
jgi:TolA-binding protein